MGEISGDKSRHNRNRRQKLAKRVKMRALRAELGTAKQGEKRDPAKE